MRGSANTWMRLSPSRRSLVLLFGLCFLLASLTTTAAFSLVGELGAAVSEDDWYGAGTGWFVQLKEPIQSAFTLRSVLTVGPDFATSGEALYLAGLSSKRDSAPEAVRLVWSPSSSGWAVLWSLRLESDTGLLPVDPRTGRVVSSIELFSGYPAAGHQYETLLSYDPLNGAIDIAVRDMTDGKHLYRGSLQLGASSVPLHASAGLRAKGNARGAQLMSLASIGSQPGFLPVGADWTIASLGADGRPVASRRFKADEDLVVDVKSSDRVGQGEFRLVFEHDTGMQSLGRLTDLTSGNRLQMAAGELPFGEASLRLEFAVDGEVRLVERRPITVGSATFWIGDFQVDRLAGEVRGVLRVSTARPIDDIEVFLEAFIHEKVWEQSRRNYRDDLHTAVTVMADAVSIPADGGLMVPFSLSLPDEPGLYELTFLPSTSLNIGVETVGGRKLFHTYQPADPKPGEPYVIAVLPDTQNYANEYPTIYIRQLQWVAENAAQRNILLALHLGDITNDNNAIQWQRSVEAITLLDGVMPYVLAQGNHDMTAAGGGNAANRESTLINHYFPVEKQPWIEGTFQPGRIENSYATFDLQDDKYIVISLEFGARDEALEWANEVIAAHPDRQGILITHAYTTRGGQRSNSAKTYAIASNPDTTVNSGDEMWVKFVSRHENMFMTLSGHHNSENGISRQVARGRNGNAVYEMMINYQFDTRGGDGHFAMFEFRPDGTIEVRAYSPYLDIHRTDVSIFGFDNHFIIDPVGRRYVKPEALALAQ